MKVFAIVLGLMLASSCNGNLDRGSIDTGSQLFDEVEGGEASLDEIFLSDSLDLALVEGTVYPVESNHSDWYVNRSGTLMIEERGVWRAIGRNLEETRFASHRGLNKQFHLFATFSQHVEMAIVDDALSIQYPQAGDDNARPYYITWQTLTCNDPDDADYLLVFDEDRRQEIGAWIAAGFPDDERLLQSLGTSWDEHNASIDVQVYEIHRSIRELTRLGFSDRGGLTFEQEEQLESFERTIHAGEGDLYFWFEGMDDC